MRNNLLIIFSVIILFLSGCASLNYNEYLKQGKIELNKENYKEAATYFKKALNEKSEEEAKELLKETNIKLNLDLLIADGASALKEEEYKKAIDIFNRIIEEYSNDKRLELMTEKAQGFLIEANNLREKSLLSLVDTAIKDKEYNIAIKNLNEILKINPKNEEAIKLLKFSENMMAGSTALISEKFDEAISLFTIALNTIPDSNEAKNLKGEALNSKKELEDQLLAAKIQKEAEEAEAAAAVTEAEDFQETDFIVDESYQDEFVESMNLLTSDYNENVWNQMSGINSGMVSPGYLMGQVKRIYRESINVYVTYPQYQSIKDNWLRCLEETNIFLEMMEDIEGGATSGYVDNIDELVKYQELTFNALYSIQ